MCLQNIATAVWLMRPEYMVTFIVFITCAKMVYATGAQADRQKRV